MGILPGQMKVIGRGIQNYNADIWAPEIAAKYQHAKFTQNKEFQDYLLATHDKELIEASPNDHLWGFGISMYDPLIMTKKSKWGKQISKVFHLWN